MTTTGTDTGTAREDESGATHRTTRPVSAVCRCGRSGIAPWCDGTHKLLRMDRARLRDLKVDVCESETR